MFLLLFILLAYQTIAITSSDSWIISSYTVLSETAQFVQLHPTIDGIAYGVRRTAGLDTINITKVDHVGVVHTVPTNNDYWRIHASTANQRLYVAAKGGGVILYDITTDPWQPTLVAFNLDLSSSHPSTITQVTTDDNYVYAVGAKTKAFLAVLSHDLGTVRGVWEEDTLPGVTGLQSVFVIDSSTIIAGDGESLLRIFDTSDLNNIQVTSSIEIGDVNTWIYCIISSYNNANKVLATHTQSGIYSVDITDTQNPSVTMEIDEALGGNKGGSPYWMERVGSVGYVANGLAGISVVDLDTFAVINYVNDGPKSGPTYTSLVANGIAVFGDNNQHLLIPNAGQSAVAGYLVLSVEESSAPTKDPTISPSTPSPTTPSPTTPSPLTPSPSTPSPSTSASQTSNPSTSNPSSSTPSPSTPSPLTPSPSTPSPSTSASQTSNPSTSNPSSSASATMETVETGSNAKLPSLFILFMLCIFQTICVF